MSTPLRFLFGLPMTALLFGCCVALVRTGDYEWTLFVIVPLSLGVLTSWFLGPTSGAQAASRGVICVLCAAFIFMILGNEVIVLLPICILMTLPLTMPMGALGGWLVYRAAFQEHRP